MKNLSKKRVSLVFLVLLLVLGMCMPVFAQGEVTGLTVDGENFTLIANIRDKKDTFEVYGLTSDYQKVPIKPEDVTIGDHSKGISVEKSSNEEGDRTFLTVRVWQLNDGIINLHYKGNPNNKLPINVFYDRSRRDANNVKVSVIGPDGKLFGSGTIEVKKQDLTKKYGKNADDTLKKAPTALGALEQLSIKSNKELNYTLNNSFIDTINGLKGNWNPDEGKWMGWHYTVNGQEPQMGPGVYRLKSNDKVEFVYK